MDLRSSRFVGMDWIGVRQYLYPKFVVTAVVGGQDSRRLFFYPKNGLGPLGKEIFQGSGY